MKDSTDTQTAELFPVPRRRGRPSTGQAMTNAERQKAYRQRKAAGLGGSVSNASACQEIQRLGEGPREVVQDCELAALVQELQQRNERLQHALDAERLEKDKALYYEGVNVKECERLRFKIRDLEQEIDWLRRPAAKKRNVTKKPAVAENRNVTENGTGDTPTAGPWQIEEQGGKFYLLHAETRQSRYSRGFLSRKTAEARLQSLQDALSS